MAGSFGNQTNALLHKSIKYQMRNICTNICLLAAPILFPILLFVIQWLINNIVFTGVDFSCGCQCVSCCISGTNNCTTPALSYCNTENGFTCNGGLNSSVCGVQYSSAVQAAWCAIPHPSNYPPQLDVPTVGNRANPPSPQTLTLITAATNALATSLGNLVFNQLQNLTLQQLSQSFFPQDGSPGIYATYPATGDAYFNGYILSEQGYTLGSSSAQDTSYLVPASYFTNDKTFVMLPAATCEAKGISQTSSLTFASFINKYYGYNLSSSALSGSGGNLVQLSNLRVTCASDNMTVVGTSSDVNRALYCGYRQARCNGLSSTNQSVSAWDFSNSNASVVNVNFWYNQTKGATLNNSPPPLLRVPGLLNLGVKAWYLNFINSTNYYDPPTSLLGLMSFPTPKRKIAIDFSSILGPLFYTWVIMLLFPTFLQQLVYEKEKRLRMMMKMHGLGDAAYWLITYCWYQFLYLIYMGIFLIIGYGVQLQYFTRTSPGILIIFFFLQGQCMIAFAFLLSSLFSSALVAVVFAYLYVFASGLIGNLLFQTFINQGASWMFYVEWIPAFSTYRGLSECGSYAFLGVYRNQPGMQFSNLRDTGNGMLYCWGIFLVEWVIFMILGWYLEQVISSGNGIRRHPLFFLGKYRPGAAKEVEAHFQRSSDAVSVKVGPSGELADVNAERDRVEALSDLSNTPIVVRDLRKVFPGQDGGKPKTAVETLTLGIERGECFGLLGPNGAGKSTSINMLTGFMEPTAGSAIVEGLPLASEMQKIYKIMGVCPQHDLLWEQLTGEEHLYFYGRLKGFSKAQLQTLVHSGLASVNLATVARKRSGQYSGGMKRRLSVAISFMGQPKVVFLDEPSTGLDPASRRGLWEVVKSNKAGRALILTTHSMEEAEMLCDRLGIFVDGRLVCIGNPKEITNRYAGYLVFTITVPPNQEEAARRLVGKISPNSIITYSLGGTLKCELPNTDISLSGVFDMMNEAKQGGSIQVLDWGVANATLEEVFIKFAKSSNIKSEA